MVTLSVADVAVADDSAVTLIVVILLLSGTAEKSKLSIVNVSVDVEPAAVVLVAKVTVDSSSRTATTFIVADSAVPSPLGVAETCRGSRRW
ncbi:MAG: hypothetical protein DRH17_12515 [Deltaproteobacteria bacterium]|nr:MAG: hypothetical protein DRH17_12515 [Deltaproteobacteria bacterium]